MEILGTFGIDGKLLLWQVINFAILFFVLKKFLYTKMLAFLDARTARIEQSLKNAKEIEVGLVRARATQEEMLAEAKKEAAALLESARTMGEQERAVLIDRTKEDIAQLVLQAKEGIRAERTQMMQEAKERFSEVVLKVARVVVAEVADKELDEELIKKALEKV